MGILPNNLLDPQMGLFLIPKGRIGLKGNLNLIADPTDAYHRHRWSQFSQFAINELIYSHQDIFW